MRRIAWFFILCGAALTASAQSDDFGVWTSVEVQKKINRKWNVSAETEFRLQDNLKAIDRWTVAASATYKPLKWLKLDAGYKLIRYQNLDETKAKVTKYLDDDELEPKNIKIRTSEAYWNSRHRIHLSATFHKKFGHFELSLREQWQYNYRSSTSTSRTGTKYMINEWDSEPIESETDSVKSKNTHFLRSRFRVEYDKKGLKWKPYASVEMYNGGTSFGIHKMRYTAGVEYKISKKHSVEVYYRYQRKKSEDNGESAFNIVKNFTDDSGKPVYDLSSFDTSLFGNNDRSCHILGFAYQFKF